MSLPDINYQFWLSEWSRIIGEGKVYSNKNISLYITFDNNLNACTTEITELTKIKEPDKSIVLRVVDLIYSWGGPSGRMFYVKSNGKISPREELETNESVYELYMEGARLAQQGNAKSIDTFKSIKGIGPSYASKHSYFWSLNSNSPLIIVDSKIAGALGYRTIEQLEKVSTYAETVESFIAKSKEVFNLNNPSQIERALFAFHNNYFLNDNKGWKRDESSEDYEIAKELSKKLFLKE